MHRHFIIAVLLLSGCARILPGAGALDGEWRLISGSWHGAAIGLRDDAPITLTVDGDSAGGRSACNSYFADVARDGGGARFTDIRGTMMACDPVVMELETSYVGALAAVARWQRDGDRLTLTGSRVELVYAVVEPPADAALVDTRWQLETVERDGTASNAADFDRVGMVFAADGTVAGAAGCTTWQGRWTNDGGRIAVTLVTTAATRCPSPDLASSAEELVLSAFSDGFAARIEGSRMEVEPEAGIGLQFRVAP